MSNILFIGDHELPGAVKHIDALHVAGDIVHVADIDHGEQLVRRIIDADEIHLWHTTVDDEFALGMVYFFSIHARHYNLHWTVKVFGGMDRYERMFEVFVPAPDKDEKLVDPVLLPPEFGGES
jgi:hypothetical protein